jgi:hypothetical protein
MRTIGEAMTRLRCKECGSLMIGVCDVILCPNGHGRAIMMQNIDGFTQVSARTLWIDSLPLAEKVGECTTDTVRRAIYKVKGHQGPFSATPNREAITDKTKPLPGEIFAKIECATSQATT